ncbi:MAG: hypothetical protein AB1796_07280 [Bacillota bacterium]
MKEVANDRLVQEKMLVTEDSRSGLKLNLAPPPCMTPFLEEQGKHLSFPPVLASTMMKFIETCCGLTVKHWRNLKVMLLSKYQEVYYVKQFGKILHLSLKLLVTSVSCSV